MSNKKTRKNVHSRLSSYKYSVDRSHTESSSDSDDDAKGSEKVHSHSAFEEEEPDVSPNESSSSEDDSSSSDEDEKEKELVKRTTRKTSTRKTPTTSSSNSKKRHSTVGRNKICSDDMSFEDCELLILRTAVDQAEEIQGKKSANSSEVQTIISIVEKFLKTKGLICYGGTAINNILPKKDQFYNKEIEIPDYDFFSSSALEDAKELANIYYKNGFEEVEAKSGQHFGTYKVFVNFIPVADITSVPVSLFNKLQSGARRVNGIMYAPPNYLRMAMYLELSRPAGDVSRWEKVLKRLTILNKHYPINAQNCDAVEFQRKMESDQNTDKIYDVVKRTLIDQGCVFFGGFAISMLSKYIPHPIQKKIEKNPDFDVLSEEPDMTSQVLKERLEEAGVKRVKITELPGVGEIISPHFEVTVGNDTVAMIYEPLACHSYNVVEQNNDEINVATIDTMLSFYLAFLYVDEVSYNYDPNRVLCMSHYLFEIQQRNRLNQKGLLKRFSLNCIGHQETVEEMRAHKANKFKELQNKKTTKEYEEWFLRYRPSELKPIVDKKNKTSELMKDNDQDQNKPTKKNKTRKKVKRGFNIFN